MAKRVPRFGLGSLGGHSLPRGGEKANFSDHMTTHFGLNHTLNNELIVACQDRG